MKRILMFILLCALLLCGLSAYAEETSPEVVKRYAGGWAQGDCVLEIRYEEDNFSFQAIHSLGEDEREVWEYEYGWYDAEQDALVCLGASWSQQCYDPSTREYEEIDWAMDDMTPAILVLEDGGETLVVSDLLKIEMPLELQRQNAQ